MGADVDYVRALIDTYKVAANKEATIELFKELCGSLDQLELSEEEKEAFRLEIKKELKKLGAELETGRGSLKEVIQKDVERCVREHPGALTSEIIEYTGFDPLIVERMLQLLEEEGKVHSEAVEGEPAERKYSPVRRPGAPAIGEELKMFCCERGEAEWMGGLLIMARDKDDSIGFYKEWEKTERDPYKTTEVDITTPGVVYDDKER
jgi:hypothetical protein